MMVNKPKLSLRDMSIKKVISIIRFFITSIFIYLETFIIGIIMKFLNHKANKTHNNQSHQQNTDTKNKENTPVFQIGEGLNLQIREQFFRYYSVSSLKDLNHKNLNKEIIEITQIISAASTFIKSLFSIKNNSKASKALIQQATNTEIANILKDFNTNKKVEEAIQKYQEYLKIKFSKLKTNSSDHKQEILSLAYLLLDKYLNSIKVNPHSFNNSKTNIDNGFSLINSLIEATQKLINFDSKTNSNNNLRQNLEKQLKNYPELLLILPINKFFQVIEYINNKELGENEKTEFLQRREAIRIEDKFENIIEQATNLITISIRKIPEGNQMTQLKIQQYTNQEEFEQQTFVTTTFTNNEAIVAQNKKFSSEEINKWIHANPEASGLLSNIRKQVRDFTLFLITEVNELNNSNNNSNNQYNKIIEKAREQFDDQAAEIIRRYIDNQNDASNVEERDDVLKIDGPHKTTAYCILSYIQSIFSNYNRKNAKLSYAAVHSTIMRQARSQGRDENSLTEEEQQSLFSAEQTDKIISECKNNLDETIREMAKLEMLNNTKDNIARLHTLFMTEEEVDAEIEIMLNRIAKKDQEIQRIREETQKYREEAQQFREEAQKLREEAQELRRKIEIAKTMREAKNILESNGCHDQQLYNQLSQIFSYSNLIEFPEFIPFIYSEYFPSQEVLKCIFDKPSQGSFTDNEREKFKNTIAFIFLNFDNYILFRFLNDITYIYTFNEKTYGGFFSITKHLIEYYPNWTLILKDVINTIVNQLKQNDSESLNIFCQLSDHELINKLDTLICPKTGLYNNHNKAELAESLIKLSIISFKHNKIEFANHLLKEVAEIIKGISIGKIFRAENHELINYIKEALAYEYKPLVFLLLVINKYDNNNFKQLCSAFQDLNESENRLLIECIQLIENKYPENNSLLNTNGYQPNSLYNLFSFRQTVNVTPIRNWLKI